MIRRYLLCGRERTLRMFVTLPRHPKDMLQGSQDSPLDFLVERALLMFHPQKSAVCAEIWVFPVIQAVTLRSIRCARMSLEAIPAALYSMRTDAFGVCSVAQ